MNIAYEPQPLYFPEVLYKQPVAKRELFPAWVRIFVEQEVYNEFKRMLDWSPGRHTAFCINHNLDIFRSAFGSVELIHVFLDDRLLGTFHWDAVAGSVKFTRYFHVPE